VHRAASIAIRPLEKNAGYGASGKGSDIGPILRGKIGKGGMPIGIFFYWLFFCLLGCQTGWDDLV